MTKMLSIKVDSDDFPGLYDLDGPLLGVLAWAQKIVDSVPEEYRATATIDVDCSDGAYMTVTYNRPETEEDRSEDARREAQYIADRDAREYMQFVHLKKKFEGQPK